MLDDWNWTVGEVVGTFGLAGEMKVRIESDFADRFVRLKQVCLRPARGAAQVFTVKRARMHKGQVLLQVEGIEDIDAAERWRGSKAQIKKTETEPLPPDSYYASELIGMEVVTKDGRILGTLDKVLPYPAQDLFQIGDILIPAVKEMIVSVDVPGRKIVVDPPEGLLPDEEPEVVE
jgi:16S rRNA processing protein RimM